MSASLAITFFILSVTFGIGLLPFFNTFTKNETVNLIINRCCFVLFFYMMTLNSAMIATIANTASIDLTQELYNFYMIFFGWGGYIAMLYLCFKTIVDVMEMYKEKKHKERFG